MSFVNYWWIFPLVIIIFCVFFMRKGCGAMACGYPSRKAGDIYRGSGESSLEILDERFAQGDIDRIEYEEKKKVLSGS